jgi:hypothetical protein
VARLCNAARSHSPSAMHIGRCSMQAGGRTKAVVMSFLRRHSRLVIRCNPPLALGLEVMERLAGVL